MAGFVAKRAGPTAPFELSVAFLAAGAVIILTQWTENFGGVKAEPTEAIEAGGTEGDAAEGSKADAPKASGGALAAGAWNAMTSDKRLLLLGAVQAFFEGAMYIFVLQWPPAMKAALVGQSVPFGQIFSCFMVCCMIGSTTFGALAQRGVAPEDSMAGMLLLAAVAMTCAAFSVGGAMAPIVAAFLVFEACVGMYFPLIGTLRSKYLPDAYRGVIMNLYGIPLNLIVVSVFLMINKLGLVGALTCSAASLSVAFVAQCALRFTSKQESAATS